MSIWCRIIEGLEELGWGSLFETALTHCADSDGRDGIANDHPRPPQTRAIGFTIAVIALSAKMAGVDGRVSSAEIRAFYEMFQVADEDRPNVDYFFDLAHRHTAGADTYARQVAKLFHDNPAVLEDLLGALFHIAKADGHFAPEEDAYLRRISEIFGFGPTEYDRIRAYQTGPVDDGEIAEDPYLILGVSPELDEAGLKSHYRTLIKKNHPDTVIAQGLPPEFIAIANNKLARINAAFGKIMAGRRSATA